MAPERRVGLGRSGDQHFEAQRPVRARGVPGQLDPVNRKAGWVVGGLVEHPIVWAGAFPVQLEVGQLIAHPARIQPEHARLVASRLLPDAGECSDRGWYIHHRQPAAAADVFCKRRMRPLDLHGRLVGGQAVTETPVDRCLGRVQRRQRLAPRVHVIELAPHHRRQQSLPAMRAEHADTRHSAARQHPSRHGHLVGEDAGGGDHLRTIEKRQGAVELGDLPGGRQLLVGRERRTKRSPHQRRVRPLLLRPYRPELKPWRRAYRWTSARARQGLPDPLTSFSGATSRTAPVGGSFARLASWVRPYLLAPSRN